MPAELTKRSSHPETSEGLRTLRVSISEEERSMFLRESGGRLERLLESSQARPAETYKITRYDEDVRTACELKRAEERPGSSETGASFLADRELKSPIWPLWIT